MRGTPTLILIDREGHLRRQTFGAESDLALGAAIAALLRESPIPTSRDTVDGAGTGCGGDACAVDRAPEGSSKCS